MGGAISHGSEGPKLRLRLMNTIDACMKYAADKDAFVSLMESEGYAVRWESGRKVHHLYHPDGMKCTVTTNYTKKYCKGGHGT